MIELDHVILAVPELDAAAVGLEREHGLLSVEGGRHPGWGTANRIVPLGAAYLELVAVVDPIEAEESAFGRWVAGARSTLLGWAVRTDELDAVAERLGLPVVAGSRTTPAGDELHWRTAGFEHAAAEPSLPFFIAWGPGSPHPGDVQVAHPAGDVRLARLEVGGDPARLEGWLGPHELALTIHPGAPVLERVVLEAGAGELLLV